MKEIVEIVAVLDRSGSMCDLVDDTIGGYNNFIDCQKGIEEKDVRVTLVLFDDRYDVVYENAPLENLRPLDKTKYFARGSTSLCDAIGKTVLDVKEHIAFLSEDKRPSRVMVFVITDGMDNTSKKFSKDDVKKMVEEQTNEQGWEFLFLGANIDAFSEGFQYGINAANTVNYASSSIGTRTMYNSLATYTTDSIRGVKVGSFGDYFDSGESNEEEI